MPSVKRDGEGKLLKTTEGTQVGEGTCEVEVRGRPARRYREGYEGAVQVVNEDNEVVKYVVNLLLLQLKCT